MGPATQDALATTREQPRSVLADQPPAVLPGELDQLPGQETTAAAVTRQAIESLVAYTQPTDAEAPPEAYLEAAWPGYRSSFPRDASKALELAGDAEQLEGQLEFFARRQGQRPNPVTWEEPGKIYHELPAVEMNGKSSAYNACDTTAEFLRGVAVLAERGNEALLNRYAAPIQAAVGYIQRHVNELGLFIEDPSFAGVTGADRQGALKVTYWKDSELNRAGNTKPHYPIIYALAHFQNAEALLRLGRVAHNQQLEYLGATMLAAGVKYLWRGDHFVTALDRDGIIDAPSSDSLHALLHIPPQLLPPGYAEKIETYSTQLETPAGYRAGIPVAPEIDPYHTMTVWTHEQALLHAAALKHGLRRAPAIAGQIVPFIHPEAEAYPFPELLDVTTLRPGGNERQAWAMGAYLYFCHPERALL